MERDQQVGYWRENLHYVAGALVTWIAVVLGGLVYAEELDVFSLGGFPLGFWVGQQGAELVFVLLVIGYVLVMNRLDRRFGVFED